MLRSAWHALPPCRLPRSTLARYAAHVEALASRLQRADVPAFCAGVAPQPVAAAALQQQQQQPGPPAGHPQSQAAAAPPAVARPVVLAPPVPVACTPQSQPPAKPAEPAAVPQQEATRAVAAGQAAGPPAAGAPAAGVAQRPGATQGGRLHTQQQLHVRAAAQPCSGCRCAPQGIAGSHIPRGAGRWLRACSPPEACAAPPQEDLTEELAGLAAQLKSNTLAIEGRLKERGQLLDSTAAALDTSVQVGGAGPARGAAWRGGAGALGRQAGVPQAGSVLGQPPSHCGSHLVPAQLHGSHLVPALPQRTRESKEHATQVHRRGHVNFCLTCLVMLIVGLAFAGKRAWLARPGGAWPLRLAMEPACRHFMPCCCSELSSCMPPPPRPPQPCTCSSS